MLFNKGVQQRREVARTGDDLRDSRPSTLVMFNLVLAFIKLARPEKIIDRFVVLSSPVN